MNQPRKAANFLQFDYFGTGEAYHSRALEIEAKSSDFLSFQKVLNFNQATALMI